MRGLPIAALEGVVDEPVAQVSAHHGERGPAIARPPRANAGGCALCLVTRGDLAGDVTASRRSSGQSGLHGCGAQSQGG